MQKVTVKPKPISSSYEISIGRGLIKKLPRDLKQKPIANQYIITDSRAQEICGRKLLRYFNNNQNKYKMLSLNKIFKEKTLLITGPCSIESREQIETIAKKISQKGLSFIRGGAFKLREKSESFQGLGEKGLKYLSQACKKYSLKSVSEITSPEQLELFEKYVDIIQIGTRNMFNYELLKTLAKVKKPIILKRGFSATIREFIEASKYLTKINKNVILCLRGIRTFEHNDSCFRNTPDLASILELKEKSRLPIIFDPSHSTGDSQYIIPISKAALVLGADGLLVEVHHKPNQSLCDGKQSIDMNQLDELLKILNLVRTKLL